MRIAIVTFAKDEELYIQEWLEYYRKLGATHFFIFDNNDVGNNKLPELLKNDKDTLEIDRKRNMVYHNRIWEYVVAKYNERLERMFSENKKPVFLICDNREGCGTFSKKQIEILSNTKYKVMFFSRYDYSQFNNANFISIQHDGNDIIQIKEKYKTEILDFIS